MRESGRTGNRAGPAVGFSLEAAKQRSMFGGGPYEARRKRTAHGLAYELESGGEPALSWTLHPYHLGDDVRLRDPDGESILRITADDVVEYVEADFTVVDESDGDVVGLLRWNLRSLLRRQWGLLDPHGIEVATVGATSRLRSTVRRRWLRLVPYRYSIVGEEGEHLGGIRGSIRPGRAFTLDLSDDGDGTLDPRLAVAASSIVDAAEFW